MVYITSYISGQRKTLVVKRKDVGNLCTCIPVTYQDILESLYVNEGTCQDVSLTHQGRILSPNDSFVEDVNIIATLQLRGGKGGFGSMLRAIGAQIEKTTNREACRDLSGRRLRDINEEKRLKDFLAKKVEKEKERLELKRKKLEQMKEGPKHTFEDKTYFEQREKRERDIYESLDKAFASGSSVSTDEVSTVTKTEVKASNKIKRRMFDDLDDSSDDESSDEDSEDKSVENKSGEDSVENKSDEDSVANKFDEDSVKNKSGEDSVENKSDEDSVANKFDKDSVENKSGEDSVENKSDEDSVANTFDKDSVENKSDEDSVGNKFDEDSVENKSAIDSVENKSDEDSVGNKFDEDSVENKSVEDISSDDCSSTKSINNTKTVSEANEEEEEESLNNETKNPKLDDSENSKREIDNSGDEEHGIVSVKTAVQNQN